MKRGLSRKHAHITYRSLGLQAQAVRVALIIALLVTAGALIGAYATAHHVTLLSPRAIHPSVSPEPNVQPIPKAVDIYVSLAVDEFFTNPAQQSEVRMILHCLLYRESHHAFSKAYGDGGLAGGPLQFHQPTWEAFRKRMMERGVADAIGSRDDLKEAIRTTVWAIKDGHASAWGPILRAMEGRTEVTCPVPSWY
jgi:hypothetical protein